MTINNRSTHKYFLWFSVFLIILFTFLEPKATLDTTFFERIVFWTFQISILVPSLIFFHMLLQRSILFDQISDWYKVFLSGLMGCIFFLPFALGIDYVLGLDDWSNIKKLGQAKDIVIEEIVGMFPPVIITWIAMNAPRILNLNFSKITLIEPDKVIIKKENNSDKKSFNSLNKNDFFDKFSYLIGTEIIYMMSELHYVRVVTLKGEILVLYNLKDAIEKLPKDYSGIQTHRSYWVSKRYIQAVKELKGKMILILSNGKTIPVSRRKADEVKEFLPKNEARSA